MAVLEKIPVTDIKLGMVIVKCDRAGVPFPEYGRPLTNLGHIHRLYDYGVNYVYIWGKNTPAAAPVVDGTLTDASSLKNKIHYVSGDGEDMNILAVSSAQEFVSNMQAQAQSAMKAFFSRTGNLEAESITSIASDVVAMTSDSPSIFSKIISTEGLSRDDSLHAMSVCLHSVMLGRALKMTDKELEDLSIAALMHDIGKVRIQSNILTKRGELSEYEFLAIARHPEYSDFILSKYPDINDNIRRIVLQHHECMDGSGYPSKLTEQYICKGAKVLGIVEAYNTMLTYSPEYPRAFNNTDAIRKIYVDAGKKYPLDMVKTFIHVMGVFPVGTAVQLSNGKIAVIAEVNNADHARPKVLVINPDNLQEVEFLNLKKHRDIKIVKELNNATLKVHPIEIFTGFINSKLDSILK